jgi:hypothetical protein
MSLGFRLCAAAVAAGLCFASPARADWKEARSQHFIVYSEGSESALRESIEKLEKYEFMLRVVSNSTTKSSPIPLKVYLTDSWDEVQATMGVGGSDYVAGYYSASSRGPIAVGVRENSRGESRGVTRASGPIKELLSAQEILLHEYAHHFMFQHFPAAYPTWYSEGFAEYYGMTRFLDHDVIEVGDAATHRMVSLDSGGWIAVDKLLAAQDYEEVGDQLDLLYAEGWLLVHYLGNAPARRGQLQHYLDAMNRGVDSRKAIDESFGSGARDLDRELRAYSKKGHINAVRLPFKPIDVGTITIRSLSPSEDALLGSDIALGRGIYASEAKGFAASVERIAAEFPQDPHALGILAEAERAAGNREAAAAAASTWANRDPKSARAKLMQAQLAVDALSASGSADSTAWDSARARMLEANKLDPNDPMVLEAYYDSFVAQGRLPPAAAQNALFTAFKLVPQDSDIRYKLARDFEARRMIPEAIAIIKPVALAAHDPSGDS